MRPALLLIDLQQDFLRSPRLEPAAGAVVERAAALLAACRSRAVPVVHVWTTTDPNGERRMPHWQRAGRWACVPGTPGHACPEALRPVGAERVVHKVFFSGFGGGDLDRVLKELGADALLVAGVHLHGCVRATVLDAYERGYEVFVASDATASDDPLHAAVTWRYLEQRAARFRDVDAIRAELDGDPCGPAAPAQPKVRSLPAAIIGDVEVDDDDDDAILHESPRRRGEMLWRVPVSGERTVGRGVAAARDASPAWSAAPVETRREVIRRLAVLLESATETESLALQVAREIGKPLAQARAEVRRSAALLDAALVHGGPPLQQRCGPEALGRRRPLGVVAAITPWNNPIAIPLGKIAPAILFGNTVVWKPSPHGAALAVRVLRLLRAAGCPPGVVNLVCGDRSTDVALLSACGIDAATVTGTALTGRAFQDLVASRFLPLQAELGGNNGAIVWEDCDLRDAAARVAAAAFGFAGQRCTATRRLIVDGGCHDRFLGLLERATADLAWGDPLDPLTEVGPLIGAAAHRRVAATVERAAASGRILVPHRGTAAHLSLPASGAYYPPTIVCCPDPAAEVVQEETFGPVLVVQRAEGWDHALELCGGVRQGLAAALFTRDPLRQGQFLGRMRAGILKINRATADAGATEPFGGWKASGTGPAEHGEGDREFYTRAQAVYGAEGADDEPGGTIQRSQTL